jgi:hypothetical protein
MQPTAAPELSDITNASIATLLDRFCAAIRRHTVLAPFAPRRRIATRPGIAPPPKSRGAAVAIAL